MKNLINEVLEEMRIEREKQNDKYKIYRYEKTLIQMDYKKYKCWEKGADLK